MKTGKYIALGLIVLALVALAAWNGLNAPARAAGTSYYVDCSAGSNGNGTQASPWNSFTSVNATTFVAGDQILLKRGTTCTGQQLHPLGSGASGSPIIIDAYGTGNAPIIAGNGQVSQAIYLYNQEYWELRNLEITNNAAAAALRRGIYVVLENFGVGDYYRLTNLSVHNVKGTDVKDGNSSAGIEFEVTGSATQTKFNDVLFDGNTVYTVDRSGIIFWSSWSCGSALCDVGTAWFPSTNVVFRNNVVYDTGGDGIVPHHTDGMLAEYNVLYANNARSAGCNIALWAWNLEDAVYQYNELYNGGPNGSVCDSQGMDFDGGNVRNYYQYNYSHSNRGGMILICGYGTTADNVARYNISQNDGENYIHLGCGTTSNTLFYNNTIYISNPAYTTATLIDNDNGSTSAHVKFYNNIFYITSTAVNYDRANISGAYDSNTFYGLHPSGEPTDPHKLTTDPLLVNPGSGGTGRTTVDGYKLQSGSPSIGSGTFVLNNGGKDYWGNTVPQTCNPDRGAHQYSTSCAGPTFTPTPTPDPTINYVQNPGFETGSLSPWGQWNDVSVVNSNQRSGSYALRAGNAECSAEQVISGLTPNTTYTLVGWAKLAAGTSGTINIGVKNYGAEQQWTSIAATSYTQGTVYFTTGASNTTATIYCYRPTGAGYGYCDDYSVTVMTGPTPTPTPAPTATPVPSNTGWVSPAANAAATGGDGNGFEGSPANAYSDNAAFATDTNSGTNTNTACDNTGKDRHVFYSYSFSIPGGSTIAGIEARLDAKADATTGAPKMCVELSWDGGTTWTAAKSTATLTKSEVTYTLGSPSDAWGRTWSVSEFANLRVRITNVSSNANRDFSLDWAPVKVYYW